MRFRRTFSAVAVLTSLPSAASYMMQPAQREQNYCLNNMHVQHALRNNQARLNGVNLGGWLVMESWIVGDDYGIFGAAKDRSVPLKGEYQTMLNVGRAVGDPLMRQHWNNWITEYDIWHIQQLGFNAVRVSLGYWSIENYPFDANIQKQIKVFTPGSLQYLDRLINVWACKYNVAVFVSLHAHPGSQNGRDHSAAPPEGSVWAKEKANVEFSIQWSKFIAARYRNSPAFLGMLLLNEPENSPDVVKSYYERAYQEIRATGNQCVLAICPLLIEQDNGHDWQNFMRGPQYTNLKVEWHPYYRWGFDGKNMQEVILAVEDRGKAIREWTGNDLIIGEWSMAFPDSALFRSNLDLFKKYGEKQQAAYRASKGGTFFWTWRTRDGFGENLGWSAINLIVKGLYVPTYEGK